MSHDDYVPPSVGGTFEQIVAQAGEAMRKQSDLEAITETRAFAFYSALKGALEYAFDRASGVRVDFHPTTQTVNIWEVLSDNALNNHAETGMNGGRVVLQITFAQEAKHGSVYADMHVLTTGNRMVEYEEGGASLHQDSPIDAAVAHLVEQAIYWTQGYRVDLNTP